MVNKTEESSKEWEASGLFILAGLFIGMGIGWAPGYLAWGLFMGPRRRPSSHGDNEALSLAVGEIEPPNINKEY
ncbi:MAG: hypothetical protein QMD53_03100 [Actinomycetota bacterium]|nr:hypothetical protein [Actinomycetota bacterium]